MRVPVFADRTADPDSTNLVTPVVIAFGSNLGNSLVTLQRALAHLANTEGLRLIRRSHWYRTPPLGPPQPDYLNGCALFHTYHPPEKLLHILLATEQHFGRTRTGKWQPRTLDLDLIFYGQHIIHTPTLTVPHPEYHRRAFVLVPLAEIAPEWRDPRSDVTVREWMQQVDCSGIRMLEDRYS
ncbi:MAG: 2-amino-4-hydroxy-6-hydroxymethyldihydropteridine diphosphokinase [Gloeomargarita sp. SKYBB_i_bin120]|nr:2-amino-4-hydroxy-6-hydroxymethyldihydropteridine diphosphokinase [Gloeomargarita sp. SKYG98]MCS7293040.1 2-amino-4-hydroxy-6-hydroxymethyldihydropteridine diphosphokinase [Gloeomargarita sp. SKYB120]MDW8178605.1 2-amino-4-hydroxy-6-hydroxymethyldihydropteridine diphosphokinase [Gloeomargarita sp. SKYBB_i_bin120]